ncbi:MAG: transposase [Rubrivivax sp.]|nr:transposase [Rubrivivax sp.]
MQAIGRQPQRAPDGAPVHYDRHRPEQTTLYRLVQQHAATFFAQAEDAAGADLPQFVKDEFDAFLECGILAHGFLRLHCGDCGHDKLVAFSCKRRGFCPSCGARRMAQTAAHLVDHVIPHVPVRQWVLSLPIPLRLLLAAQPKLVTPVLQVVHRVITRHLLGQAGLKPEEANSGAVTLIQRFGSAANLNIHLHCLVLDGVYRRSADGTPEFVEVPEPTDEALQAVLHKIITRLMGLLTRRGVLVEEEGSTYMADNDGDSDEARTLRPLHAAACTYRIAFGPRAGQKVLTLQGAMPRETDFKQHLCADIDGFSLHAAVRCGADDRQALEQLCRYITRPALANERVQTNAAGQVVLKLKTAWRDGTTHLLMSPLEFMQRLAALVPRPRLHLIRFHGVLAPNAKLRAWVVPQELEPPAQAAPPAECEASCAHHHPVRLSWAKLLKRVFEIDMEHCPNCGGELKIIAAILEQPVIEKILTHLGLQARAPPRAPARGQALQAA